MKVKSRRMRRSWLSAGKLYTTHTSQPPDRVFHTQGMSAPRQRSPRPQPSVTTQGYTRSNRQTAARYLFPTKSITRRRPGVNVNRSSSINGLHSAAPTPAPLRCSSSSNSGPIGWPAGYQVALKRLDSEPGFAPVVNMFLWHPLREEVCPAPPLRCP